jgi:DNA polymerase III epsilon subunit-like protein
MAESMQHLNQHLLCSIDTELTGLRPGYHEIVQISICPLNAKLEPSTVYPVFDIYLKPNYPERIDSEARRKSGDVIQKALDTGMDRMAAADLLENWNTELHLPEKKRIVPLGFNYAAFDKPHIQEWIGWEHYNAMFDSKIRDLFVIACMMNDFADFNAMEIPFPRLMTLTTVARRLGVDVDDLRTHDSLYDCDITRRGYVKTLTTFFNPVV